MNDEQEREIRREQAGLYVGRMQMPGWYENFETVMNGLAAVLPDLAQQEGEYLFLAYCAGRLEQSREEIRKASLYAEANIASLAHAMAGLCDGEGEEAFAELTAKLQEIMKASKESEHAHTH